MIETKKDLRHLFGAVCDQGARPTCLAFAASDAHAGLRDGWKPLSCEYAFYHAQQRAGRPPMKGAVLSFMLETLRIDGQPAEEDWAYLPTVPSDPNLWKPPAPVGELYGRNGSESGQDLDLIIASLERNRPVILLTMLSASFFIPNANGIVDPGRHEVPEPAQRHAVIAVGHGLVNGSPAILARNSWGASWGVDGHAWLTEQFLKPRLFRTALLAEKIDVFGNSTSA